jgi:hypothetical protein
MSEIVLMNFLMKYVKKLLVLEWCSIPQHQNGVINNIHASRPLIGQLILIRCKTSYSKHCKKF